MKKFALTLRFEFQQPDDPAARGVALSIINMIRTALRGVSLTPAVKLQEILDNRPPRKVNIP